MQYHTSTQKKYWCYKDEATLEKFRREANESAIERIKNVITIKKEEREKELAEREENDDLENEEQKVEKEAEFLTYEEERILLYFYEIKIKKTVLNFRALDKGIHPPYKVIGTASIFFKRFFLHNSCMDYNLQDIFYVCMFLAFKNEERTKTLHDFLSINVFKGKKDKYKKIILDYELTVVEQLHFHLQVLHPQRPVDGLLTDIYAKQILKEHRDELYNESKKYIEQYLLTDLYFLESPSKIGAACLLLAAEELNLKGEVESYLGKVFEEFPEILKSITTIIAPQIKAVENNKVNNDSAKKINNKVKTITKYYMEPGSKTYRQRHLKVCGMREKLFEIMDL